MLGCEEREEGSSRSPQGVESDEDKEGVEANAKKFGTMERYLKLEDVLERLALMARTVDDDNLFNNKGIDEVGLATDEKPNLAAAQHLTMGSSAQLPEPSGSTIQDFEESQVRLSESQVSAYCSHSFVQLQSSVNFYPIVSCDDHDLKLMHLNLLQTNYLPSMQFVDFQFF